MAALLPSVGVVVAERATGLGKEDVVEAGSEMCIRDSLEVGRVECAHQRWHRRLAAVDVEADQAVLGAGLTDEGQRLQLREGVLVLTLQGQGDGVAGDLTLECVGRTLDDDAAVVDDGHAVAERVRLLEVVGRQEHRGPAVAQLADLRPEVRPGLGIEAGGGLVEKDKAGPVHQADGDVETAPLAARVRLRLAGRAALDLEGLEQLSGTDLGLALAHPVEAPLEHKLAAPRLDDVAAARLADVADAATHQASLGEQVGVGSVASMLSVVGSLAALGPRKPKISPLRTSRSTPRTASTVAPPRVVNVRRSRRVRMATPPSGARAASSAGAMAVVMNAVLVRSWRFPYRAGVSPSGGDRR